MRTYYIIYLLLAIFSCASVLALPHYDNLYVNDFAHVLEPADAKLLEGLFIFLEENTTAQVVFVSVDTTEGMEISDYALALGEAWRVGQKDMDNGIVILYAADSGKLWVSTGYGVEGVLPDSKIGRLLDQYYVPYRDEGSLSQGIVEFSFAMGEELFTHSEEIRSGGTRTINLTQIAIIIVIFLIIFYIIFRARRRYSGFAPVFFPHGGWSGSSGSSFGGGHFGGGGAGR